MTSQQVITFLSLAGTLNFTRTADNLFVTQPVISRQLVSLETELGFKLFVRSHQEVHLTEAGMIMRDFFNHYKIDFDRVHAKAFDISRGSRESIIVGLLELFDNSRLLSAIGMYSAAPIRVERYSSPCLPEQLINGRYDIGITFKSLVEGCRELEYHELFLSQDHLLFSIKHPMANLKEINFSDISDLCMVSDDGKVPANVTKERMKTCNLSNCPISLSPNLGSVLASVESGLNCTILQGFSLPFLRFEYLAIPLPWHQSVGVVCKGINTSPAVREFINLCL